MTRRGDFVQTASHRPFWPLDPRPEDVHVEDIAHALSNLCRFTGHTREFYSVAQHSVLVSRLVRPKASLVGLLHDAAEAYTGDVSRPLKRYLYVMTQTGQVTFENLKDAEAKLLSAILKSFGIVDVPGDVWGEVNRADDIMLAAEARDLMTPLCPGWTHNPLADSPDLPGVIEPWLPARAKKEFLTRFAELRA